MTTTHTRPECDHLYPTLIDEKCGVLICVMCTDHKGIEYCYCGWSRTGIDGNKYLRDMGEDID